MGSRTVIFSDLSTIELDDTNHVTAIVRHPDVSFPVKLDLALEEADKLQNTALRLVSFEVHAPNAPVRSVQVETRTLDKLFAGVNWDDVIAGAKKAETTEAAPAKRGGAPKAASTGEKLDYTSPEHAGKLHRGRVTEAEAEWVKANREQASYNRNQQTGNPINWDDPAEAKRYSL